MENKENQWMSYLGGVFIFILILVGINWWNDFTNRPEYIKTDDISSYTTARRENWELTLYSSSNPNYLYEVDTIKGLVDLDACLSEGHSRVKTSGSFECSYKCKTQYTDFQGTKDEAVICEKVCDEAGNCR